ncbi:unnamed protein product [Fusarium venenatum]|uniref:Uncharacterized protein n=1 Tax=Fusarium venenatum TaxID=56646 RepID=A0A2L2TD18_9HYPO|nr:uncharacterized protein FVRRES_07757 [Fusarium venenatum]CEI63321.1 unnamed protein product [Fusarium venenatum]
MIHSKPISESVTLMAEPDNLEDHHPVEMTPHVKAGSPENSSQSPFWLTKAALLLFVFIFASCSVSLIAMHRFMHAQGGLPLKLSSSEYSWTYGPTAVLVIIMSLWRRIDYYYKSTQPWMELQSGPVPASRSLLLDYISPFQLQSMYQAFRFGHYRVTATIFSFFLMKAIILVSTTLFVVQNSSHHETIDITYQNTFDAAQIWSSPSYNVLNDYEPFDSHIFDGSENSVWGYLARLNGAAANNSAWKTEDGLVSQQFRPTESSLNITSLEAQVEVFVPNITCEDATLVSEISDTSVAYSWNSSTCSAGVATTSNKCSNIKTEAKFCGEKPWHYSFFRANCSNGIKTSEFYEQKFPHDIEKYDIRHVITAAQYNIDLEVAQKHMSNAVKLIDYTAIICKIGYSIVSTKATYNPLAGHATISTAAVKKGGTPLHNLTSPYLAEMLFSNLYRSGEALVTNKTIMAETLHLGWERRQSEALFQMMAVALGDNFEPEMFLNSSILRNTSIAVVDGLLNELARELLLVNKESKDTADGLVSEPRLCTRSAAVWAMAAGFALLAAISLLPVLQNVLRYSGHSSENDLVVVLDEAQFKATTNGSGDMSVEISKSNMLLSTTTSKDTPQVKAWVPLTGSLPFVIATIAFPILAIGVLELLHQLSNQRQGLIDMHKDDSTGLSYVTRIASTAVVFAIATMFNSLDFNIATLAPYSALRSGSVQANRSILFHLLSVSPFLVIMKTLRAGYFGAATSNISTLLGSFLTIVVSGLWILTGNILLVKPSSVMVTNWHASWPINGTDDGGAAVALNLIRNGGANASLGIWEDIVLPDIELSVSHTPSSDLNYQYLNYTYRVGALRPFLSCMAIPSSSFTLELDVSSIYRREILSAHFLAPYSCGDVKVNKMANISFGLNPILLRYQFAGASERAVSGFIGGYIDLNTTAGTSDAECPSVGVFFGRISDKDIPTWNLTALVCSQGIEQIPVDVTYKGNPALRQINEDVQPKLERDEGWRWMNKTSKSQTLGYRLHRFLDADLVRFAGEEDLIGPNNVNKLIRAVERNYAEYMRIVIDRNFRANKNNTAELMTAEAFPSKASPSSYKTKISGTSYEYGTRLAINSTSKLILQILLAAMAVLGLASYLLVKIDGTLPRNPCSIASTMGFLAGSQLCDPSSGIIPRGAEYMSDKELANVFDGWVFSLGWWHTQRSSDTQSSDSGSMDVVGSEQEDGAESTREVSKRFGVDVGCADVSKF